MPNIDTDAYFFTAVVPLNNTGIVEFEGAKCSPVRVIRQILETMPTALQTPQAEKIGINSPFARNLRTHFARFVVIDQPHFNGRMPSNPIIDEIKNTNMLVPNKMDQLSCPHIAVMIDFDLTGAGAAGEPEAYLAELWNDMEAELRSVFQYCYGFDRVSDGTSFADYLVRCQIETTMSFHDYWWKMPDMKDVSSTLLIAIPAAGFLLPLLAALLGWIGWSWAILFAIVLALAGAYIDYRIVMAKGAKPFPAAPGTSLRNVLKGLYLQQAFTRLAPQQQGRTQAEKGAAFRAFLAANKPGDLDGPTQPPGVIRSKIAGDGA